MVWKSFILYMTSIYHQTYHIKSFKTRWLRIHFTETTQSAIFQSINNPGSRNGRIENNIINWTSILSLVTVYIKNWKYMEERFAIYCKNSDVNQPPPAFSSEYLVRNCISFQILVIQRVFVVIHDHIIHCEYLKYLVQRCSLIFRVNLFILYTIQLKYYCTVFWLIVLVVDAWYMFYWLVNGFEPAVSYCTYSPMCT